MTQIESQHQVATAGVMAVIEARMIENGAGERVAPMLAQAVAQRFVRQNQSGDWGETSEDDAKQNDIELETGGRAMSVFRVGDVKVWVISDGVEPRNRKGVNKAYSTTLLLPEEY